MLSNQLSSKIKFFPRKCSLLLQVFDAICKEYGYPLIDISDTGIYSGSYSQERGCLPVSPGDLFIHAFLPFTCLRQVLLRVMLSWNVNDPDSSTLVSKTVVHRFTGFFGGRTSQTRHALESVGVSSLKKVSEGVGVAVPSCLKTARQLVCKAGVSKEVQRSLQELRKLSKFFHWC